MSNISFIEYEPQYAKAVADMWNRSSSVWNGRIFNSSEKKVLQEEENSTYLNLYLAVIDSLVIGYAKFSPYPEEKGVSYIDMLGVDPEWHGKGIGKVLVQKCVLRAAELGYDRIDLFTWPGNTKAVPLYKKCGFFWEKMEMQVTHLMNFIPGLLNNELIKPYFDYFDWYLDSKREIEIKPDGRCDNGFEIYDYIWEKEDKKLQISFEKRGRGIIAITTSDFHISTYTPEAKPVFGTEYPITYRLESFMDEPIEVFLQGENDREIDFTFAHSQSLVNKLELNAGFYLNSITKELTEWDTLPSVVTKLNIMGKSVRMKTGLKIQYPLDTTFAMEKSLVTPSHDQVLYLNVQNCFSCKCLYRIDFENEEPLQLERKSFEINLKPRERSYIPIKFTTPEACIIYPTLKITALPENGKEVQFNRQIHYQIYTLTSKAQKVLPNQYILLNGRMSVSFDQLGNKNWGMFQIMQGMGFNLCPPRVGKPYSEEFDQELPYDVQVNDLGVANELVMYFRSKEFQGVEFAYVYKLYPTGLMEFHIRIINLPIQEQNVFAKLRFCIYGENLVCELGGRLIKLENDMPGLDTNNLDGEEFSKNWAFSKYDDCTSAMIWDKNWHACIDRWFVCWDINLSDYYARGLQETEPVLLYIDVFQNAFEVRNVAEECNKKVEPMYPSLELVINNEDPFPGHAYEVKLIQHQTENLRGSFILSSSTNAILREEIKHKFEDEVREIKWTVEAHSKKPMEVINCEARLPLYTVERKQIVFHEKGEVRFAETSDINDTLLVADNGIIQITTAKDARIPNLLSLIHEGREWLDNSYPEYAPKSNYNPYPGGMTITPWQLRIMNLMNETHEIKKASLLDQWGHKWEGLEMRSSITNFDPLQGLVYVQYYLMRPGVPILAITTKIITDTGHAEYIPFCLNMFFKPNGEIQNSSIDIPCEDNRWHMLHAGSEAFYLRNSYRHVKIKNMKSDYMLNILSLGKSYHDIHIDPQILRDKCYLYSDFAKTVPSMLRPMFIIFSGSDIEHEWLYSLLNTRF